MGADLCAYYASAANGTSVRVNQAAPWDVDALGKITTVQ